MIDVKNVSKIYYKNVFWNSHSESILALNRTSFCTKNTEFVCIFGSNGSGKSTLIKILCGILAPSSGEVRVLGQDPFQKKNSFLKKIAVFMNNSSQMDEELSVESNFEIIASIYSIDSERLQRIKKFINNKLGFDEAIWKKNLKMMSFGQRALIEVAGTLISYPRIILLDEPFVGIDPKFKKKLILLLKTYCRKYKSQIVFTTLNINEAKEISDKMVLVKLKGVGGQNLIL